MGTFTTLSVSQSRSGGIMLSLFENKEDDMFTDTNYGVSLLETPYDIVSRILAPDRKKRNRKRGKRTHRLFPLSRYAECDGKNQVHTSPVTVTRRAIAILRPLRDLLLDYVPQCRSKSTLFWSKSAFKIQKAKEARVIQSWRNICTDIVRYVVADEAEKSMKNDLALLLAKSTGKSCSSSFKVLSGVIKRILLRHCARMNRGNKRSAELIMSLYESKRCWLELPASAEKEALSKHKAKMVAQHTTKFQALKWIIKAVDVVVPPRKAGEASKYDTTKHLCIPTFSACFEQGKKNGGTHELICRNLPKKTGVSVLDCVKNDKKLPRTVSEDITQVCLSAVDDIEHEVKVQVLPEPGKFRIITKGNAELYTGLRRVQRFLLNRWAVMPFSTMVNYSPDRIRFRMNDNTCVDTMTWPGKGKGKPQSLGTSTHRTFRDGGLQFISGDYDAATDSMHIDCTITAIDRIFENMGMEGSPEHRAALHTLKTAKVHYEDGTVLRQSNGQLMGHPLSFPILCIINLSTYMRTMNRSSWASLATSPMLINGDDILFKGDHRAYQRWRKYANDVGLIVNELKTYIHPKFNMINSIRHFGDQEIFYSNLALAIGHRVKSEP